MEDKIRQREDGGEEETKIPRCACSRNSGLGWRMMNNIVKIEEYMNDLVEKNYTNRVTEQERQNHEGRT